MAAPAAAVYSRTGPVGATAVRTRERAAAAAAKAAGSATIAPLAPVSTTICAASSALIAFTRASCGLGTAPVATSAFTIASFT